MLGKGRREEERKEGARRSEQNAGGGEAACPRDCGAGTPRVFIATDFRFPPLYLAPFVCGITCLALVILKIEEMLFSFFFCLATHFRLFFIKFNLNWCSLFLRLNKYSA